MRTRFYLMTIAAILSSLCPILSWGQEQKPNSQGEEPKAQEAKPVAPSLWGFDTEGQMTWGYRFTTVKGDMSQYNDIYNLHNGFRLFDVDLSGRAREGSNSIADSYSLTASGLGGDPYPGGQLTVRKDKLYDLRISYRQSYYYWSQNNNDSQVMAGLTTPVALGGSPSGFTNGLTANHDWATVRRMGSMSFNLRASNNLQFSFEYDRNSRDGMTQSTRSLYYPGPANSNSQWGGFTRANPYIVAAPLNELSDRITGGISYTLHDWVFHYRVGYQSFTQDRSWNNLASPEQSIDTSTNVFSANPSNINAITSKELLTSAAWSESRRLTTPVSEFSYNGAATSWLELRGSYNYYNYNGPDTADASFIGTARTNSTGTTFAPYAVSFTARAHVDEPSHDVSQGLTATIKDWWKFNADYRYSRVTTDGVNAYGSVYNAAAAAPSTDNVQWLIGSHSVDLNMEFIPIPSLDIRAGIRYLKRDVEQFTNGIIDTTQPGDALNASTLRTKNVWPTVSVFYKPVKTFSVRGDFQSKTTTDPYTRLSTHTNTGSRFLFRYQPSEKVSIEDNLTVRSGQFQASSYTDRYRSNALNVSYNLRDRFSVNAGYTYESIFDSAGFIGNNATTPFNGFQQDAFINRGMLGGIHIKPAQRFGIDLSGHFLRTTGASQLYSNVPTASSSALKGLPIVWPVDVGPLTFPLMVGTLYYDFPSVGRLSVDLQRSYYIEQIVKGNNFQANMLTIKWTKFIKRGGE
jgi:hypothetical protein